MTNNDTNHPSSDDNAPADGSADTEAWDEREDDAYREDDDYMLLGEEPEASAGESDAYPFEDENQGPLPFDSDPETEKLWSQCGDLAAAGKEKEAIAMAIAEALDDENRLTNELLFGRHPELGRRKLRRGENALIKEWKAIRDDLVRPAWRAAEAAKKAAEAARAAEAAQERGAEQPVRLKKVRLGYSAYCGERVEVVLRRIKERGKLDIADDDIEMLQRMANVETKGLINAVNSWDSVFMSAGFMQWPVLYKDPVGKLQEWIQRAPEAFARYGIELDEKRVWKIPMGKYTYTSIAIARAVNWRELREREWAERFYRAGLDDDAVAAEVVLALEVTEHAKKRIARKVGDFFLPYYERSVPLRALIQETFNHRPAWLYQSLKIAIKEAQQRQVGFGDGGQFLSFLHKGITNVYDAKNKAQSGQNLIRKTGRVVL